MKTHARVVVIGGGVVGASVLYHLARAGWTDVMLLERKRLTAGSTWHAAAGFHAMNSDANIAKLQKYTIGLYKQIQQESGQDVGLHITGGVSIACNGDRWDMLKNEYARHRVMGLDTRLVTPEEIRDLCPLFSADDVLGGLHDPTDGHLDPYGATLAYARSAKLRGAEVHEGVKVESLSPRADGAWEVVTNRGTVNAEHVVNAAGLWAREVGQMGGVHLPLIPMEHHYLITDAIPELEAMGHEIPLTVDLDGGIYMRQEGKGALFGIYEQNSRPWSLNGTSWEYGESDLLPPRMDDLAEDLMRGFRHFPKVEAAGIKRVVNGPFTFSPDGNPLVGPVPGLRNYWAAVGVMAGFSQGGGVGLTLAQWMTEGAPDGDVFAMDVARYGPWCSKRYVAEKAEEFYRRRFQIAFPNEVWPAGRPLKQSPAYALTERQGAMYTVGYGLEQPAWFAGVGVRPQEEYTFRRSSAHARVGEECRAARETVGLWDAAAFGKYEVTGPGARAWIDRLVAGRLPAPGQLKLSPMLAHNGRLMGDLTVACIAEEHFWLIASYGLQAWHLRWFHREPLPDGVTLRNISDEMPVVALMGPNSRALIEALTSENCSDTNFKFMHLRLMDVALAPATVARLAFCGELGFEIHCPAAYAATVYAAALREGAALGVRPVGIRALLSLRLEKSFGIWSREYSPDYTAAQSGMDRFIDFTKPAFTGCEAALAERKTGPIRKLVTLEIDALDADATGYEPIWHGRDLAGFITSGGYGHTVGKSLAMGYLNADYLHDTENFSVDLLGERHSARIVAAPVYDPSGRRMRA
jgi:dimethylglycine dehydrogenase